MSDSTPTDQSNQVAATPESEQAKSESKWTRKHYTLFFLGIVLGVIVWNVFREGILPLFG